jgi:hypothetical protein
MTALPLVLYIMVHQRFKAYGYSRSSGLGKPVKSGIKEYICSPATTVGYPYLI